MGDLSLHNVFLFIGMDQLAKPYFATDIFYEVFLVLYYIVVATIAIAVGLHLLLVASRRYLALAKISDTERMCLTLHVLFFLFFTAQVVPWSVVVVRLLFSSANLVLFAHSYIYTVAALAGLSKTGLYLVEGVFRSVVRPNSFLIIHHLLFGCFILIAFGTKSIFAIKVNIILDVFATFEFPLYAGLISRRLKGPYILTQGCFWSGMILYGITRVMQLVLLVYVFAGSYTPLKHSNGLALWWVLLFACIALVVLQMVTFSIYRGIMTRTRQRHQDMLKQRTALQIDAAPSIMVSELNDIPAHMGLPNVAPQACPETYVAMSLDSVMSTQIEEIATHYVNPAADLEAL